MEAKERNPILKPDPAGETRWSGCITETETGHINLIMGDLCDANDALLSPDGMDFSMVADHEGNSTSLKISSQ